MSAPTQVVEPDPTVVGQEWQNEEQMWETLNKDAFGHQGFSAITTKAMYVLGVTHSICRSVTSLLKGPLTATYLPAYGVFASGVDLLGRCIQGNHKPLTAPHPNVPSDLKAGFRRLANSHYRGQVPNDIIQTNNNRYTVDDLVYLRHFAARGQATSRYQLQDIDYEIIEKLKPLMMEGLDTYWEKLKAGDQSLSNNLAKANVIGFRPLPVQVILRLFSPDPVTGEDPSVLKLFSEFDWRVQTE